MSYEFDRYVATVTTVNDVLNTYGVAIIPNVLNEDECDAMNKGMWDTLEHLTCKFETPIERNNPNSWRETHKLFPLHSMLIQHWNIGHAQYVWDIRQNIKIIDVFSKIWNCKKDELLVSFDGVAYHMPPEITKRGWYRGKTWYHSDQSYLNNELKCIQGWVTGYDVNEGDATLSFLESSNHFHKDFKDNFDIKVKEDWYKLNENEFNFYVNDKNCIEKRIKCPKGSLVLWDSRTIHCGGEALKTRAQQNIRNVVYVCYEPKNHCEPKKILKKIKAFEEMRMTSHWPCKATLFPKMPRTYGAPVCEITKLTAPILNDIGKKLVGY